MNTRTLTGHLAAFGAYAIFGFNILFCKDISNEGGLPPFALFSFRAFGAVVLFWGISFIQSFLSKKKADPRLKTQPPKRDLFAMCGASLLGLVIPQLTFLKAITVTTPIDLAVTQSITPIMTMFVAAIFLKEPITFKKAGGVMLSFCGIVWLILQSASLGGGADHTEPIGIALVVLNSLSFALYLGIYRPLISRYDVITLMKWMFLFALIISLPFSIGSIVSIPYASIPTQVWWEVGYLIFFATFVAYFLIPIGQQRIRPTLVSMYNYLQPIIATILGIAWGMDILTWSKVLAALAVLSGVAIVNRSRAKG